MRVSRSQHTSHFWQAHAHQVTFRFIDDISVPPIYRCKMQVWRRVVAGWWLPGKREGHNEISISKSRLYIMLASLSLSLSLSLSYPRYYWVHYDYFLRGKAYFVRWAGWLINLRDPCNDNCTAPTALFVSASALPFFICVDFTICPRYHIYRPDLYSQNHDLKNLVQPEHKFSFK